MATARHIKRTFELTTKNATLVGEVEFKVYVDNGSVRADLINVQVDEIHPAEGDSHSRFDVCEGARSFRLWSTSPQREGWFKLADDYAKNKIDILDLFFN